MKFIPQNQLDMAVLYKLFLLAQDSDDYLRPQQIADLFSFPVSSKRVELALDNLESSENVNRMLSAGRPATINPRGYGTIERELVDQGSFVYSLATLGDAWFQTQGLSIGSIPASDRIVSKTDNQDAIISIGDDLASIEAAMSTDNEVGAMLGDERDLVQGEIVAAKELLKQPRFRLRRILELLLPALKYLADKFAGAGIGETAKHLIKLLLELL